MLCGRSRRSQARYLYLRAVRQAAERGLARPPHRTPLEFTEDLGTNWPDAEPDVQTLTDAFVDARYALRDLPAAEIQNTQSAWRRLMEALRRPSGRSNGRAS